jgi:hypothetical protein
MNLERVILSQSKKVDSALATLKANRRYQQNKLAHELQQFAIEPATLRII